tara:strand:- start:6880 stop:7305 length:426 start_codon:yes stop_codon:yes gene_type:complete
MMIKENSMFTFDDQTVSDLHKDARGFRPHAAFMEGWNSSDDENKQAIWDGLIRELERHQAWEAIREREALSEFQGELEILIESGAGDRQTALRWMTETETFHNSQSVEHWVFNRGILFTDFGRELVKELMDIVTFEEWETA